MKKILLQFLIISGGFLVIPNESFSQNQTSNEIKVTQFLNEVYLNCPQYVDSIHISRGVEFLERLKIHSVALGEYPECLLLSSVPLKDKCNENLTNDVAQFNWETFNPFKYLFSFYSTQTVFYRVDGTEFIIEISPIK